VCGLRPSRASRCLAQNEPKPRRSTRFAATQRGGDLAEDRRDDDPQLTLGEVRVGLGQP